METLVSMVCLVIGYSLAQASDTRHTGEERFLWWCSAAVATVVCVIMQALRVAGKW